MSFLSSAIVGWGLVVLLSLAILYWIYSIATGAPVWRSAIPGGIIGFIVGVMERSLVSVFINSIVAYFMALAVSFVVQKYLTSGKASWQSPIS